MTTLTNNQHLGLVKQLQSETMSRYLRDRYVVGEQLDMFVLGSPGVASVRAFNTGVAPVRAFNTGVAVAFALLLKHYGKGGAS